MKGNGYSKFDFQGSFIVDAGFSFAGNIVFDGAATDGTSSAFGQNSGYAGGSSFFDTPPLAAKDGGGVSDSDTAQFP